VVQLVAEPVQAEQGAWQLAHVDPVGDVRNWPVGHEPRKHWDPLST